MRYLVLALFQLCAYLCLSKSDLTYPEDHYLNEPTVSDSQRLLIVNLAGYPIELFEMHPNWETLGVEFEHCSDKRTEHNSPIEDGHALFFDSQEYNEYVIRFSDHVEGHEARFVKGISPEAVYVYYEPSTGQVDLVHYELNQIEIMLHKTRGSKPFKFCDNWLSGDDDGHNKCMLQLAMDEIDFLNKAKQESIYYRDLMSYRLRNYTCADETLNTTTPYFTNNIHIEGKDYKAEGLLDTPAAKIWVVRDFITPNECDILLKFAEGNLTRATVGDDENKGGVTYSEHRRAQQAHYTVPNGDDPLWPLMRRVFSMTNQHANMNLSPNGQAGFTVIQYNVNDEYTPHCDGYCDGSSFRKGSRVATAVLYCKTAARGGGTTFTKADVFVKPEVGMATFFTFKDPVTNLMDQGYTEHSGCPILEGEKWITTVWMREETKWEDPWGNYYYSDF